MRQFHRPFKKAQPQLAAGQIAAAIQLHGKEAPYHSI